MDDESDGPNEGNSDASSIPTDSDEGPQPDDALVEFMCGLLLGRHLSAHHFCTAMRLAGQAGIKKCDDYGFREGAPVGITCDMSKQ